MSKSRIVDLIDSSEVQIEVPWMNPEFKQCWVTVIIPTYQRAKYIIKALNSVYNQSYRPVELIVVDDGSTDNTKDLIEAWINSLPSSNQFQCTYIYQENAGAPRARNVGLCNSKGEFIQTLDSDDILHPAKLETQVELLIENPKCQSAWNPLERFLDEHEKKIIETFDLSNETELLMDVKIKVRNKNIFFPQFLPSAGLHRREVFFKTGPWLESLQRWQDLEYQSRMSFHVSQYVETTFPFYFFRQHDGIRIQSQFKQKAGLKAGFHSLSVIENNLALLNYQHEKVSQELSSFYFSLVELAIKGNARGEMRQAIRGAKVHRNELKFQIRLDILWIVFRLFGSRITSFLLSSYLKK